MISRLKIYVELIKPRVTSLNLLMTLGGFVVANAGFDLKIILLTLLGTTLAVGSANALNMVLERDSDALMHRTKGRPLPAGRITTKAASVFGLLLALSSIVILGVFINPLTMYLSTGAILMYVLVYTPLKKHTPLALLIGAIPGAIPPLLGWVAATGEIGAGGLALFAILLIWQLPHFIAITLYLNSDYRRAGIRTVAAVRGEWAAKAQALAYATLLIPVSLLPVTAGLGGEVYTIIVVLAGLGFWYMGLIGFRKDAGAQWARRFFLTSLVYLPVLTVALYLDVIV